MVTFPASSTSIKSTVPMKLGAKPGALGVCHPLGTDGETEAQREEAPQGHTESGKVRTRPQDPQAPHALLPPPTTHYFPSSKNDC